MKCSCCEEIRRSHCSNVDKNGNDVESECINSYCTNINNNNSKNNNDKKNDNNNSCINNKSDVGEEGKMKKPLTRLQAIGLTDDEDDFGEIL